MKQQGQVSGRHATAASVPAATVIENVSVVDVRDGSVEAGLSVVVADGIIREIAAGCEVEVGDATVIDGAGRFVVPGFLDMHAHVLSPSPTEGDDTDQPAADDGHVHPAIPLAVQEANFRLLLANGVTGFQQMNGSEGLVRVADRLNAESAEGHVLAPEVLTVPGDAYVGQAPAPAAATALIQAEAAYGADFIKVLGGPRGGVLAVLAAADAAGLDVAGHLPNSLTTPEAVAGGWDSFEHLGAGWGILIDGTPNAAEIRAQIAARPPAQPAPLETAVLNPRLYDAAASAPIYEAVMANFDQDTFLGLVRSFLENDVTQTATLIRLRTQSFGSNPIYRDDPNLRYLDPDTRALWERLGAEFEANVSAEDKATLESFYDLQLAATGLMQDQGVRITAGSDFGGIWILPGFGLHQEFRELAAAGLTPLEVLQATTLNGAEYLNRDDIGVVEVGRQADLVLLDANPIEDVAALDRISGVMVNGTYLSAADIEALKAGVAAAYNPPTPGVLTLRLSQDAFGEGARFAVSLDGVQLGTGAVAADRAGGEAQDFAFATEFGDGPGVVTVDFLNDAYAGVDGADRNLVVEVLLFDGRTVEGAGGTLYDAGPRDFAVPADPAAARIAAAPVSADWSFAA